MLDLANLGIVVDSSQVKKANEELEKFVSIANRTKAANDNLANGFRQMGGGMSQSLRAALTDLDQFYTRWQTRQQQMRQLTQHATKSLTQNSLGETGDLLSRLAAGAASAGGLGVAFAAVDIAIEKSVAGIEALSNALSPPLKTTEELLEAQEKLNERIKKGYEDGATAADKFAASLSAVTRLQSEQLQQQMQQRIDMGLQTLLGSMTRTEASTMFGMADFQSSTQIVEKFRAFTKPIEDLQASMARGAPDVRAFREAVASIGETSTSEGIKATARALIEMTNGIAELDVNKLAKTREELEKLSQAKGHEEFTSNLKALLEVDEEANKAVIKQLKIQELIATANKAISAIAQNDELSADAAAKRTQILDALAKAIAKVREEEKEAPGRFEQATQAVKDQISELQLQAQTAGRAGDEVMKLKTANDLLRAAARDTTVDVEEEREAINKLAEDLAKASTTASRAKLRGDVLFERDQLGRNDVDAQIASRMRGAGLEVDLQSVEAQIIRVNEGLKSSKDLMVDFTQSLVSDLQKGIPPLEALNKALGKVLDTLIQISIRNAITAGFGGIGGGLSNGSTYAQAFPTPIGVPLAHSGGIPGAGEVSGWRTWPRFHSGRTPWGSHEMPAIIRKDEGVFTPEQMKAMGSRSVNIKINNYGAQIEQREQDDGTLELTIRALARDEITSRNGVPAMRSRYDVNPRMRSPR